LTQIFFLDGLAFIISSRLAFSSNSIFSFSISIGTSLYLSLKKIFFISLTSSTLIFSDDDSDEQPSKPSGDDAEENKKRKREQTMATPVKKPKIEAPSTPSHESCSIFVGSLSWGVTDEMLREHFSGCGNVLRANVPINDEGKSRGIGFVDFDSPDAVTEALKLDGSDLDGRNISVQLKNKPTTPKTPRSTPEDSEPSRTLFVGGLSYNSTYDSIRGMFESYGIIEDLRHLEDKGMAYIDFSSVEEAQAAKEATAGQDLDGRWLRVNYAAPRNNGGDGGGGFRGGRGRGGRGGDRGGGRGGRGGRGGDRGRGGRGGRGSSSNVSFQGKKTSFGDDE